MHFVKGELTTSHHWLRSSQQHLSPSRYNSPEAAVPQAEGTFGLPPAAGHPALSPDSLCLVTRGCLAAGTPALGPEVQQAWESWVRASGHAAECKDHALRAASRSQGWGGDQSRAAVAQSHKKSSKLSSCSFPNGTSSLSHKIYPCTEVEVPFGQSLYKEAKTSRISPCQEHKLLFRVFCRI